MKAALSMRRVVVGVLLLFVLVGISSAERLDFYLAEPVRFRETMTLPSAEWTKFLGTEFSKTGSIGGMVGGPNTTIIPELRVFGVTIIPRISADTRTGAKLTATAYGKVGLELHAAYDLGGLNTAAEMSVATHMELPDPIRAGRFFQPVGAASVTNFADFDLRMPGFSASAGVVCNVGLDGKFEYGLFPFVPYGIAPFNWGFDWNWELFNFNMDLNLPDWPSLSLPGIPDFTLPDAGGDALMRIKLPPKNPLLSFAEIQLVNPVKGTAIHSGIEDKSLYYLADGDLLRLGIDIDGIASWAATGVSFTGTEIDLGIGKLTYDLIDVKYGPELGFEYEARVTPYLEVELTFDRPVLVRRKDGTVETVTSLAGAWNDLPEMALTDGQPVGVDVEFTGLKALFDHTGRLTLTDYMEIRALYAKLRLGGAIKGLTIGELGPVWHKKFSILGALLEELKFDLFNDHLEMGVTIPSGLLDTKHHFVMQATSAPPVYMAVEQGNLVDMGRYLPFAGTIPAQLVDATLVVATAAGPVASQEDLVALAYVDPGQKETYTRTYLYMGFVPMSMTFENVDDPLTISPIGGLWVPRDSTYQLRPDALRRLDVVEIINDGQIDIRGWLDLHSDTTLSFQGQGQAAFHGPATFRAESMQIGPGQTLEFLPVQPFRSNATKLYKTAFYPWGPQHVYLATLDPSLGVWVDNHELNIASRITNAGTLRINGATMEIGLTDRLVNEASGLIEVTGGGSLQIATDLVTNAGRLVADAGQLQFDPSVQSFGGTRWSPLGPAGGWIEARNGGTVELLRTEVTDVGSAQGFWADDGGLVRFAGPVYCDDLQLRIAPGGEMRLNGLRRYFEESRMQISNEGLLVIESGQVNWFSLMGPTVGSNPGQTPNPRSRIETIDLHNSGTIRILPGASLVVKARITDYDDGGAALVGGTWQLLGAPREFSNLESPFGSPDVAQMGIKIVEIEQGQNILSEVFELEQLNTNLVFNLADVTLSGAAAFPNFNTIGSNIGSIRLAEKQQFHTAGDLENWGRIAIESGAGLYVNGSLRVPLGELEVLDGSLSFTGTLETVGGRIAIGPQASVSGLQTGPGKATLQAGWTWQVHEATRTDPDTGDVLSVEGGLLDLQGISVGTNHASVLLEGNLASFPALAGLETNTGELRMQNAARLTLPAAELLNTGTIELGTGAWLILQGDLRNEGRLSVGADSLLDVQGTLTLSSPEPILLDGVIQAAAVDILQACEVIGSGRIVGDIKCAGLLGPGSSPGTLEVFGDVLLSAGSSLLIELPSLPTDPHAQLRVHGALSVQQAQLLLLFDPDQAPRPGGQWVILQSEGMDPQPFAAIDVQGLAGFVASDGSQMVESGRLLGSAGDLQLLLFDRQVDGQRTVSVGLVPEPTVLLLMAGCSTVLLRRRRQPRAG